MRQMIKLIRNAFSLFIIALLAVMAFHGKPEPQAAGALHEDDSFCLVQNVYHEGRGESALGQAAAHLTLNRVTSPPYPHSVCGAVGQKGQFPWTEEEKNDRMTDQGAIGKPVNIAFGVAGPGQEPTGGAFFTSTPTTR